MKKFIFALACVSLLTACGENRQGKDKKLALGCQAGIKALLNQDKFDHQISSVKNTKFSDALEGRQVLIEAVTKNKTYGYEQDEAFTCVFEEGTTVGPFGYKAEIMQLNIGDEIFGKKDGEIHGDMNDFLNLTGAVEAGMK